MSEKTNWKGTLVLYASFALAAVAFTLAPENWAFFVAIAIVLAGWFLSESIPAKTHAPASGDEEPGEDL